MGGAIKMKKEKEALEEASLNQHFKNHNKQKKQDNAVFIPSAYLTPYSKLFIRDLNSYKRKTKSNSFNKILLEGVYTSEQLVEALKYDVQSKKDNSISTGTNNLTFMQNSLTYLKKKTFEPFIEIIKEGKEIKNNDYYAGSTDI